jgi:RNA polymerase subunit RPABC4/transcription elongation factor Spt4
MSQNLDLRRYQDSDSIAEAFGKIVSGGKSGYKTVIERKKIPPKCSKCGRGGDNEQKFCPQCGGKMVIPVTNCPGCKALLENGNKFCTNCGFNLQELVIAA